jgi:uncharacterized protein (TIGR00297 family)
VGGKIVRSYRSRHTYVTVDPGLPLSPDLLRWLLGAIAASLVAVGAWKARSLSTDGMIAAAMLGTVIVGAGGWWAGLLLIAFFLSSSVLSRTGRDRTEGSAAKGSQRDAMQVVANGGIAVLCALLALAGSPSWWLLALAGSLAAANADTWSTEIGRRSVGMPRLITSGRRVPTGTSGAVSVLGTLGALGGGSLIGMLAAVGARLSWIAIDRTPVVTALAVALAGVAGSLVDSLIGATIQHQFWCQTCEKQTERSCHRCGTSTQHLRGWTWVTNDAVNIACVLSGALIAALLAFVLNGMSR